MVRIKICGITRVEDALAAAAAGADAIGLVFYAASPRAVSIDQARAIIRALPPFVTTVGLFVDASEAVIRATLEQAPLDLLQFHGSEPEEFCLRFSRPYIKALRVRAGDDLHKLAARWPSASGILLIVTKLECLVAPVKPLTGPEIPAERSWPLILAGGLQTANVRQAIEMAAPWAVDVSGGVEADKGVKDIDKINAFIHEVRRV